MLWMRAWRSSAIESDVARAALNMCIYSVAIKWLPSPSLATECTENISYFTFEASVNWSYLFRVHYKMYVWTRMNDQGNLELALESWKNKSCIFWHAWFWQTQCLAYTFLYSIDKKSAVDHDCKGIKCLSALRYSAFCNVLHIWSIRAIPTYESWQIKFCAWIDMTLWST